MIQMREKLLREPCRLCKSLCPENSECNEKKKWSCDSWEQIFLTQWNATCKFIRDVAEKK